jgi:hypothetical protein
MGAPNIFGQFRRLFGVGTLSGLGEGAHLKRHLIHHDEPPITPDGSKLICGMKPP